MKVSTTIAAAATFAGSAHAFWRMECKGRVGIARLDPIVNPGTVAQHVHAIHGSNGLSESSGYDELMAGDCTSCAVVQDKSSYWHPSPYFQHADGTFELVEQVGGMLAYYLLNANPGETIKAFPPGFQMISGTSTRRTYDIAGADFRADDPEKSFWAQLNQTSQYDLAQRALGFNCMNYNKHPEGTLYRHYIPDKDYLDANCADGLRMEIMFPSCWNGKDLDSPDHKSHVAFPDLVMTGNCPEDFPVRLPGLLYETIWATNAFAGKPGKFVLSNGDEQGFGYHADFVMGWDEKFLQAAVDTCTNPSGLIQDCPLFTIQTEEEQNKCKLKNLPEQIANELVTGVVGNSLPGNVPIQGPGAGTQVNPSPPTTVSVPSVGYSPGSAVTSSGNPLPGQVFKDTAVYADPAPSTNAEFTAAAAPTPDAAPSPDAGSPAVIGNLVNPGANSPPSTLATSTIAPEPSSAAEPTVAPQPTVAPEPTFAPEPTQAPATVSDDGLPVVSTQYITNGNIVSEVVWKEAVVYVTESEDVTVTVTVEKPTASVQAVRKLRRSHDHAHVHRHMRHGGRR
ncbi:hypothetical protein GE09DRAFT_1056820 [Coniochaeta sp. 2T2.1]|nr:hypothetical protein GE09DRAFT_1056820 [Coniochaeta sp. 2T2.1]